ncbi:MAG: PspC domain-containing protein [Bacteroidales bacterium]|nr:PspC domain-containing protein [Bacteroidales bacterium]
MKKTVNVGIGGRSFAMDEDAYSKLKRYLNTFRTKSKLGLQSKEVMDDLEERISELFSEEITQYRNVVDITLVEKVIAQLGMPDGEPYSEDGSDPISEIFSGNRPSRKFYRNPDNKSIAGVCSGIAAYLNIDTLLVRIIFIIGLFMGSAGFWIYVILWIAAPMAETPAQKCELNGLPVTAENLRKFSSNK